MQLQMEVILYPITGAAYLAQDRDGLPQKGLSATLPQAAQPHQGFGSMLMRSLTAD